MRHSSWLTHVVYSAPHTAPNVPPKITLWIWPLFPPPKKKTLNLHIRELAHYLSPFSDLNFWALSMCVALHLTCSTHTIPVSLLSPWGHQNFPQILKTENLLLSRESNSPLLAFITHINCRFLDFCSRCPIINLTEMLLVSTLFHFADEKMGIQEKVRNANIEHLM